MYISTIIDKACRHMRLCCELHCGLMQCTSSLRIQILVSHRLQNLPLHIYHYQ